MGEVVGRAEEERAGVALCRLQIVAVPEVARLHVEHDRVRAWLGVALLPDRSAGGLVLLDHAVNLDVIELEAVQLRLDLPLCHDDQLVGRLRAAQVDELVSVLCERVVCHGPCHTHQAAS